MRKILPISRSRSRFVIFDEGLGGLLEWSDLPERHSSWSVSLGLLDSSFLTRWGLPGGLWDWGKMLPGRLASSGLCLVSSCHGDSSDDSDVRGRGTPATGKYDPQKSSKLKD